MSICTTSQPSTADVDRYKFAYYMTSVDNIPSIARYGLLSHRRVSEMGIAHTDISEPSVQLRRCSIEPIYNRSLHDYVPLYFNPKNPMLSARRNQQSSIVILEILLSAASAFAHLFTDGNAASGATQFGRTLDVVLASEDVIFARTWFDHADGKRKRCAEMLVLDTVPVSCFVRAIAIGLTTAETAAGVLKCPVHIDPNFFF